MRKYSELIISYPQKVFNLLYKLDIEYYSVGSKIVRECISNPEKAYSLSDKQLLNVASKIWEIYVFCRVAYAIKELTRGMVKVEGGVLSFEWGEQVRRVAYMYRARKYGYSEKPPHIKPNLLIYSLDGDLYALYFQFPTLHFNIDIVILTPSNIPDFFIDAKLHPSVRDMSQLKRYSEIASELKGEFGSNRLAIIYYHPPPHNIERQLNQLGIDLIKEENIELYIKNTLLEI